MNRYLRRQDDWDDWFTVSDESVLLDCGFKYSSTANSLLHGVDKAGKCWVAEVPFEKGLTSKVHFRIMYTNGGHGPSFPLRYSRFKELFD